MRPNIFPGAAAVGYLASTRYDGKFKLESADLSFGGGIREYLINHINKGLSLIPA